MEAGEGSELATEGLFVLGCSGGGQFLEREVLAGSVPILDEPNASGSSLTEEPFHQIAVAGTFLRRHGVILLPMAPFWTSDLRELSR